MVSYPVKVGKNCLVRKDLREKSQKMLFKLESGSRDLPRERMDVSPAGLERQCGLRIPYQIEIMEKRVCEDRGNNMHRLYTLEAICKAV